jgi:lysophospholipase L1-like esterase
MRLYCMSVKLFGFRSRGALLALVLLMAAACGSDSPIAPGGAVAITCPSAVDRDSVDGGPVSVTFDAPHAMSSANPVTTICSMQSGNMFSVGTTTVSCQASDAAGKTAACSFTVTIHPPPKLQYTKFLSFGDSLTFGKISLTAMLLALDTPDAYPTVLRGYLRDRYVQQQPDVINAGVDGEFATSGAVRLRGVLLSSRPEVLLLMEGTNDLGQFTGDVPMGAARALSALDAMIAEAQSQNIRVCLATIPPQRSGGVRHRDSVAAYIPTFNNDVRALATRRGAVLVDVYNGMKDDISLIGADDLHPTPQGYQVMAKIFFNAIRDAFEIKTSALAPLGLSR